MCMHFPCACQSSKMHRPVIQIVMRGRRWMDFVTLSACAKLSIINLFLLVEVKQQQKIKIKSIFKMNYNNGAVNMLFIQ